MQAMNLVLVAQSVIFETVARGRMRSQAGRDWRVQPRPASLRAGTPQWLQALGLPSTPTMQKPPQQSASRVQTAPSGRQATGATQAPPVQTAPNGQLMPQAPQLPALLLVSTHTPPQAVCPAGQESWSQPPWLQKLLQQSASALQRSPNWAQLPQAPLEQNCPAGQTLPHAPQLALSVSNCRVSTH